MASPVLRFRCILLPVAPVIAHEPREDITNGIVPYLAAPSVASYNTFIGAMNGVYDASLAAANTWVDNVVAALQLRIVNDAPTLHIVMTPEFCLNGGTTLKNGLWHNGRYPLPERLDTYIRDRLHARIRALPHKILFTYSSAYYTQAAPVVPGSKWPICNRITILTSDAAFPAAFAIKLGVNEAVDEIKTNTYEAILGQAANNRIEFPHWTKNDLPLAFGFATCNDLDIVNFANINILLMSGSGTPFCRPERLDVRHPFLMNDSYSWSEYPAAKPDTIRKSQLWAAGYYEFIDGPVDRPSVADTFRDQRAAKNIADASISVMNVAMARCYWFGGFSPPDVNPGYTADIPFPPRTA